jgi:hypothetical protein
MDKCAVIAEGTTRKSLDLIEPDLCDFFYQCLLTRKAAYGKFESGKLLWRGSGWDAPGSGCEQSTWKL